MGAVARQELEAALLELPRPLGEEICREQPLHEVVDPTVALTSRDPKNPGLGECLEDRPHLVRGSPVPVDRPAWRDVGRRQMAVRPNAVEELVDELGVLGEDAARLLGAIEIPRDPEPGQVGGRDDAETLVVGLVEHAFLVEQGVGQLAVVARNAGEKDEVVIPARHLEGIELDRAESREDGKNSLAACGQGPRRGEEVAQREKPSRRRGRDRQSGRHPSRC